MSFYDPSKKGPNYGQGIQDAVMQFMQMMMMRNMMGSGQQSQQPSPPGVEASGQAQLGQPRQAPMVGAGIGNQPQPTMGSGPQGMAQAGVAGQMGGQVPMMLMQALKDNPQLLQFIMQTLRGGQGGM